MLQSPASEHLRIIVPSQFELLREKVEQVLRRITLGDVMLAPNLLELRYTSTSMSEAGFEKRCRRQRRLNGMAPVGYCSGQTARRGVETRRMTEWDTMILSGVSWCLVQS